MSKHEIGENIVSTAQPGGCDRLLQEATRMWSSAHERSVGQPLPAGLAPTPEAEANRVFSHQMKQFDNSLHALGGPLHGRDDLHMVGYDNKGRLMIAHVPPGKSRADEMYVVDPRDGKIVAECAWKNGKPDGQWKRAAGYSESARDAGASRADGERDFEITNMREYLFEPQPGQQPGQRRDRFDQIDADGSGALSKAEFENFQKTLPPNQRAGLDVILKNFDAIRNATGDSYFYTGESEGLYRQDLDQWLQKYLPALNLISGPDAPPGDSQGLA